MDRKTIMGIAAVAGIGLLLYLRKSGDAAAVAGAGSTLAAAGGVGAWGSNPLAINAYAAATGATLGSTKPATVDSTAANQPPEQNPAPQPAASGSASRFVGGPGGSNGVGTSKYYYRTAGPNGVIAAGVEDQTQIGMLDTIKGYLDNGFNVNDKSQVQTLYDHARATGRTWEEANRDIAAASGYLDNDVTRVAVNAGVAKW